MCAGCLLHARTRLYSLNNGIVPGLSSDVTEIPPGFPLPPASVGHAVQTDQRSHDKERANTGALSAASTNSQTARGHRETPEKRKKGAGRKSLEAVFFFFFWLRPSESKKEKKKTRQQIVPRQTTLCIGSRWSQGAAVLPSVSLHTFVLCV